MNMGNPSAAAAVSNGLDNLVDDDFDWDAEVPPSWKPESMM